jgi:hypothetical protein
MIGRIWVLTALLGVFVWGFAAAEPPCPSHGTAAGDKGDQGDQAEAAGETELKAEVPALTAFHEVIFPLWHTAWPEKDTAMMKELLPQVREHVEAVAAAELPGILRDKSAAWAEGLDRLRADLAAYETAAAADDEEALMSAVESLHTDFEKQVRVVRPVMKELDAYHVELYKIYHRHLPAQDLESLREASAALSERCARLSEAPVPDWVAEKSDTLKTEIAALCERTQALQETAGGGSWEPAAAAVESVHDQYRKVEALFD